MSGTSRATNGCFTSDVSRRHVLQGGGAALLTSAVPFAIADSTHQSASSPYTGARDMSTTTTTDTITTQDGVTIFYKDWGAGRHSELVAPGHDGRSQGALRRHSGVFPDRLHRRPQKHLRADTGYARR